MPFELSGHRKASFPLSYIKEKNILIHGRFGFLEAKICGPFKRSCLEMGMGTKSRERHDFFIFIFMESFVRMRQGVY